MGHRTLRWAVSKSLFVPLQRLREEVRQLKQSVEAVTN